MFVSSFLPIKVFAGPGTNELTKNIYHSLQRRVQSELGSEVQLKLADVSYTCFSNQNWLAQAESVKGYFVIVVFTQTPPVSDNILALYSLLQAIANAKPEDILLVMPYMPYSRSDLKNQPHISVMALFMAQAINILCKVKSVLLLDPHEAHIKHFFDPWSEEVSAMYLLIDYLERNFFNRQSKKNWKIVFPDSGANDKFGKVAHLLKLPSAYIYKVRTDNSEKPKPEAIIGNVRGKDCLMFDDEILTGNTVIEDSNYLLDRKKGRARSVSMVTIHPIIENKKKSHKQLINDLENSKVRHFITTDSVPVINKLRQAKKFTVLPVADLLAEAIWRIVRKGSITELHNLRNVGLYRPSSVNIFNPL